MTTEINKKYEEFKNSEGDVSSRLRKAGFISNSNVQIEIESLDDFIQFLKNSECVTKENLKVQMKKIYRNSLTAENIENLFKMGNNPFTEQELIDAKRLLPLNEDGSISVDDIVDFL